MVTIEYIARSALMAYRDTGAPIARATLKCLGIKAPPRRKPRRGTVVSLEAYTELLACFENRESPMDGPMGAAI